MQESSILLEEITRAIKREPRINGEIDVEVAGCNVRLRGFVTSLEQKDLAGDIAGRFGPVNVENDITIETATAVSDPEALRSAKHAIDKKPDLAHDIGVDRVIDGIAYIKGKSESIANIKDAAEIVASTPGVRDVVSEVKIKTDVLILDSDLISGVKQALRADSNIHEEFIDVEVKGGVVHLSGTVSNLKQKTLATNIAQNLPGVTRVINNIDLYATPSSLDKALELEAIKALEADRINMRNMNLSVLDGVAFLDGTVDSINQRDQARATLEALPGIRLVQNDLAIGFHIEPKAG
ncbi:MAG: BON domain-containing protein [Rubrobacteridae bacterium]|nr:BON domain-containing protein [Rubrobacteridae bacterium]